jgi:UDPglucose 6-dehydrogenase
MKIAVVGMGYVGLANAIMLSIKNEVSILEISSEKVDLLNRGISPIKDKLIEKYLKNKNLRIKASTDPKEVYKNASFVIICTPTDFIYKEKTFNTASIEEIVSSLSVAGFKGLIIIKSTVPIGFTESLSMKYPNLKIAFFPEFLREGSALQDCLEPSRLICGSKEKIAAKFLELLKESCKSKKIQTLITHSSEAEAIKLFANSYLAMRVAFFNELDSFAISKSLNAEEIIRGISLDQRIGCHYNNPSFGYGGYCLPKDTKQLLANFESIPHNLLSGAINSNKNRKAYLSQILINSPAQVIGIYKLAMKAGSDNHRESAVIDIIKEIKKKKEVIIFDNSLAGKTFMGIKIFRNIDNFFSTSELIVANRFEKKLSRIKHKLFTRDIFNSN